MRSCHLALKSDELCSQPAAKVLSPIDRDNAILIIHFEALQQQGVDHRPNELEEIVNQDAFAESALPLGIRVIQARPDCKKKT